ncbi:AcrR family transcriptional regulator [Kitasatospora kifunensis]|uniref:AcrR family transcriptional regulator n=1 Tax=Kitasatospora kifunensis TaxID=58351 RepID=A0A7W7RBH1_KITKI|nr:AcrR family transcriptional regulator [Kitasatospora kifunensis]
MSAVVEVLAQRGQEGVTLREVTDRAEANVAAVSYHFGSLKTLCDTAIEDALEQYLDAQMAAVDALDADSDIEELAAAFAGPMMRALAAGGRELAVMRTVARVGIDPPKGWDRLTAKFQQSRRDIVRELSPMLPGVGDQELNFRIRCAAGLLNWLALAPVGAELAAEPPGQIERWLVPVLAGAFRGSSATG